MSTTKRPPADRRSLDRDDTKRTKILDGPMKEVADLLAKDELVQSPLQIIRNSSELRPLERKRILIQNFLLSIPQAAEGTSFVNLFVSPEAAFQLPGRMEDSEVEQNFKRLRDNDWHWVLDLCTSLSMPCDICRSKMFSEREN
jgi:hypothetical protein